MAKCVKDVVTGSFLLLYFLDTSEVVVVMCREYK